MNDFLRVTENKVPLQENHGKKKPIIKTIIKINIPTRGVDIGVDVC